AVSTTCYVLNRVSITNPHNKTPYELLSGKVPNIRHLKRFGCQVTILNTSDHLGKFEGKANDGFLVGNLVPAAEDPAGSVVPTDSVPAGSVLASGALAGSIVSTGCVSAGGVPASGVPAGGVPASSVPAGGVLAGSIVSTEFW
nr:retrovirus-related Pol polyprotein from transposon TNT 1-94 [Tanacetum cinerariifolium]